MALIAAGGSYICQSEHSATSFIVLKDVELH